MSENCLSNSDIVTSSEPSTTRNLYPDLHSHNYKNTNESVAGLPFTFNLNDVRDLQTKSPFTKQISQARKLKTHEVTNHTIILMFEKLCKIPDQVIEKLASLRVLDLSHNQFEYFPVEITQIPTLRTLRLNNNKIRKVPSEISKLPNLETFSMIRNQIKSLPASFSQLSKLKELNLEGNLIENFGQEITGIKSLECLNIHQNRLLVLPSTFYKLIHLKDFKLEWIRYVDPSASCYFRGQEGINCLKTLRNHCEAQLEHGAEGINFLDFCRGFIGGQGGKEALTGRDKNGGTILHLACLYEDISVIRYIISSLPEFLDVPNNQGMTPFCLSILKDKHKSSNYLLRHGANPTKGGGTEGSPLHIATKMFNSEIVKGILMLGENPNRVDEEKNTPLHLAMASFSENDKKMRQIVFELVEHGAELNAKNGEGWTPLQLAARARDNKAIAWASDYNRDILEIHGRTDTFDFKIGGGPHNWTLMHLAAYSENKELVDILAETGANMIEKSLNGYTPKKVITRAGLALKLMEKYERAFIKKKLFQQDQQDNFNQNENNNISKQMQDRRTVKSASKDLFGVNFTEVNEVSEFTMTGSRFHQSNSLYNNEFISRAFNTQLNIALGGGKPKECELNSGAKHSPAEKPQVGSLDILPESENNSHNPSMEEIDETHPEFHLGETSEKNEGESHRAGRPMQVKVNQPLKTISKNSIIETAAAAQQNNKGAAEEKTAKTEDEQANNEQEEVYVPIENFHEFDLEHYAKQLNNIAEFNLHVCKKQAQYLEKEAFDTDPVLYGQLKVLYGLQLLHNKIQKSVSSPSSKKELLSFCPQTLIRLFGEMKNYLPENVVFKIHICKALGDMKNPSVRDFLRNVVKDPKEDLRVKQEAFKSFKLLKEVARQQLLYISDNLEEVKEENSDIQDIKSVPRGGPWRKALIEKQSNSPNVPEDLN